MGIWQKISIFAINSPKLHYLKSITSLDDDENQWKIQIESTYDLPKDEEFSGLNLRIELKHLSGQVILVEDQQVTIGIA